MRTDAEGAVPVAAAGGLGLGGKPDPLAGLGWPVPHYSTLSRRQQGLTVVMVTSAEVVENPVSAGM